MPTLDWIGKEKVVNHHQEVPYRVLERRYSYGDADSGNMIIRGDNLEALKALLPRYEGRVKCVYIDPPYNTGNEGWVYNDNVNDPKIRKWLGEVVGKEGEDLTRHDKWLCMMYPRLRLLRKLLAEDGVFFVSIGDDEQANLKLLCNEIFGARNFIAMFVWKSRAKPSNTGEAKFKPQNDAEYILCYKKYAMPKFLAVTSGKPRSYPHHDKDGDYRLQTILKSNRGESKRETMTFELNGYRPPASKRWQAGEETIHALFERNRITFETGEPMLKYYKHEEKDEISPFYCYIPREQSGTAESGKMMLNHILGNLHGFDTVKPIEIIQYILMHSLSKDAVILDSFAGSGTTAHAVLNMNKADGGNRKFILVEMEDYADSITAERVKRVIDGYGDGKNAVAGTGGGFDFYDLGEPLMIGERLNEAVGVDRIREYVWFMDTKQPFPEGPRENPYCLGTYNHTTWYFYYEPQAVTTLNYAFLASLPDDVESAVIYADRCAVSEERLWERGITFKKIPRDIARL
ncbi:MAG: site-specific DNA-methyltransferase [Oscillospiraceae bacterium]|nr:site-specific DNA-methyltransferase [Oscillospiraceae bacterium]